MPRSFNKCFHLEITVVPAMCPHTIKKEEGKELCGRSLPGRMGEFLSPREQGKNGYLGHE